MTTGQESAADLRSYSALMTAQPNVMAGIRDQVVQGGNPSIRESDLPAIEAGLLQTPVPLPAGVWETQDTPHAQDWFRQALEALQTACLGLDLAQIAGEGAYQERFALTIFSSTTWLLRLRYPLGPAIRTAEFIVDLEAPDGVFVVSLCGRSDEFHDRLYAYRVGACYDAECVADFTRIFCTFLSAQEGMFIPCESREDLEGRYLGEPDKDLLDIIRPWGRLSPPEGINLPASDVHIFHGALIYGQKVFLANLVLALPRLDAGHDVGVRIWMSEDVLLTPEDLPMIPARRDALTHAYYPLRRR